MAARWSLRTALCAVLLALAAPAFALYTDGGPVKHDLTDANFQSKLKGSGLVLLELYAPWCGHCKALTPEWEKLAKTMNALKLVTVAAADCDANKQIGAFFNLKGFPTIVATLDGKLLEEYKGERKAPDIGTWAMKLANAQVSKRLKPGGSSSGSDSGSSGGGSSNEPGGGKAVAKLTGPGFEKSVLSDSAPWVVEFYAPWCGHCKQLAPEWAKAAEALKPLGVRLGAVDCTAHAELCSGFDVKGYPTILVFGKDKMKPKPYEGARKSADIISFGTALAATDGAPIEVPQLTGLASYEAACTATGRQACVLAFLPHILDATAAGRNKSLAVLSKSATTFAGRPWGWAWLEGGSQPHLETTLGVAGYPAVSLVNAKKGVASTMRSSFSEANVKEYLNSLPGAREVSLPAAGEVKEVPAWDGKDGAVEEMEDEFDLSELMGTGKEEL